LRVTAEKTEGIVLLEEPASGLQLPISVCSLSAFHDILKNKERALRRGESLTRLRPVELAVFCKWLLRVRRIETEAQGLKLLVDPASNFGQRVLGAGTYEPELTRAMPKLLKPGGVFVDAGANEGWFSLVAAKLVGPAGRVLACEPQERLWPVILRNAANNQCDNIQLCPCALSGREEASYINLYPSTNTGSSHLGAVRRRWERKQSVSVVRLERLLNGLEGRDVNLLKIDVEGHALQVLEGAGSCLGRSIRKIVIELHEGANGADRFTTERVVSLLRGRGYVRKCTESVEVWTQDE
jgi:FkbM family methyltransferase